MSFNYTMLYIYFGLNTQTHLLIVALMAFLQPSSELPLNLNSLVLRKREDTKGWHSNCTRATGIMAASINDSYVLAISIGFH